MTLNIKKGGRTISKPIIRDRADNDQVRNGTTRLTWITLVRIGWALLVITGALIAVLIGAML